MHNSRPFTDFLPSDTETVLDAAAECNLVNVLEFLKNKADINAIDFQGFNALQLAILCSDKDKAKERVSVISALLDAKADTEHTDVDGFTALLLLVENETYSMHALKRLLEVPSLNFNAVTNPSNNENRVGGLSALHIAIKRNQSSKEKFVQTLLKNGKFNLEIQSQDGVTPLGLAITENAFPIARLLLEAKANPENTGLINENPRCAFQPTANNILILVKIFKIRKLLALPFGYGIPKPRLYKKYFAAWISIGAGSRFLTYAEETSEKLKALLIKYNAQPAYELALATDEFLNFFNSFPDIFPFFANELRDENSLLEQMHGIFFEGLIKPKVIRPSGSVSFNYSAPFEWKIDVPPSLFQKNQIPEKVFLRTSDSHEEKLPNFEVSIEEYKAAISELGIKQGVEKRPNSLLDPTTRIKKYIHELRSLRVSDLSFFSNSPKNMAVLKSVSPKSSMLSSMMENMLHFFQQPHVLLPNNLIFHMSHREDDKTKAKSIVKGS